MAITLNGTTGITSTGAYSSDGISFADDTPSNTLVTTTGGNVGIGTSSPTEQLCISGTAPRILLTDTDTGGDSFISAASTTGSLVLSADINNEVASSSMIFSVDGSERMRIDSSGYLLLGVTGSFPQSGSALAVTADGGSRYAITIKNLQTAATRNINFLNNSDVSVGYIQSNTTATVYGTTSDYRLKENIAPMTGALAKVQALKPVTYKWKSSGEESQGFIAHELAEVCPEAVAGEKDAFETVDDLDANGRKIGTKEVPKYQGIDTSFLVATLTCAIQELKAELDTVKTELATLKGQA
jgi:hypothetical protein